MHCCHLLHLILFKGDWICCNHATPRIIKTLHHLKPEGWFIKEFSSFHPQYWYLDLDWYCGFSHFGAHKEEHDNGWKKLLVQSHAQSSTLYVININIENATGYFYLEIFVKNGHELSTSSYSIISSKSIISVWTMPMLTQLTSWFFSQLLPLELSPNCRQPRSCPLNIYTIDIV